jgi:hypothetical protein
MFFMDFDTVRASATKISRDYPLIQEKVNDDKFRCEVNSLETNSNSPVKKTADNTYACGKTVR